MNIGSRTLSETSAPQHSGASSPRELRAQAVQRLQVGLFGLALMLLLVGLANIIMDHARANEATLTASSKAVMSSSGAGAGNADPLADISMLPAPDVSAKARPAPRPAAH
jgi:hypothetical protein